MYNPNFKPGRFKWIFPAVIIFPALILFVSWIVMLLWNAILPAVIHVEPVNFLQALGILILSRILVGGFRFFSRPWHRQSSAMREKWMNMSAEEKEKFREEWKKRCP
jgi:Ca2+/H+ antiporter, TMEM165/GDT1 family